MKFSKNLLGTTMNIEILDEVINPDDFIFCTQIVEQFEQKYSRFIEGNFLSILNRNKTGVIDKEFYSILELCIKISTLSEGYFDITTLPFLENAGYGINKERMEESCGFKNIVLEKTSHTCSLKNNISIEIGSVGKGFLIDSISIYLEKKYNDFIIDFGGDIKVIGTFNVHLENPLYQSKSYGCVHLKNTSIASSNGIKRTFTGKHHLINDHKKLLMKDKKTTLFVIHKSSAISDIIATALFVSPLKICKKIIMSIPGIDAYIVFEDGRIFQTPGFTLLYNK